MPGAKAALMAFHIPMTERFGWSLRERPIIAFLVSDPSKTLDQAREAAIADARRKAEVYAQASSLQLRRVEWITEDAGFAPPGPMRAQGASVPMAVSVPIATGEETLQPPAKRHCELGLQLASIRCLKFVEVCYTLAEVNWDAKKAARDVLAAPPSEATRPWMRGAPDTRCQRSFAGSARVGARRSSVGLQESGISNASACLYREHPVTNQRVPSFCPLAPG